MIRLFINGLAASAGGGLTYLRNVLPQLAWKPDVETTVLVNSAVRPEFKQLPNVTTVGISESSSALFRTLREQAVLPRLIRDSAADVLISTGNFALWKSPVPQILLSRNSLYTSADFLRDLRERGDYAIWMDTLVKGWFARQSISCADITVAPSEEFARDLSAWSSKNVVGIHHGFDADAFSSDATPLPADVQAHLADGADAFRLLFVSHYNYYRNFETLLRAMPLLTQRLKGTKVKLYLTCRLNSSDNPGTYKAEAASSLLGRLREQCNIVELGTIPYRSLHHLYRACHLYVTPAYAESFSHPLVEAMSSGLPVVASNLPVHREICADAAVYFHRFSPEELASAVARVCENQDVATTLSRAGRIRAQDFSWKNHVESLLALVSKLAPKPGPAHKDVHER
jgi:glycosyltransferase involved in cell wall biosynthesis